MNILDKNISELIDLMDREEITSEEIIKIYLKNISEKGLNKEVYKSLCEKESIEKAREIDKKRKNGEKLGALAGIPIAVTEDISTKGILTEAGSKILKDYIPPFNATIIEKLLEEDAIILGKVKISEFSLENSEYSVKCILDKGASVLIGSDGEGKDVVKLQPGYGLVSRYGIISATSSLSPLTLMAKEANDLSLVLNTISGYDRKDSTSVNLGTQGTQTQGDGSDTRKIARTVLKVKIVKELVNDNLVKNIEELGINIEENTIETVKYILPAFRILSSAEFASATARYDGIRYGYRSDNYENREELYKNTRSEGFGKEAKKTIIFGNHVINAEQYDNYYKKSQKIRSLIKYEINKILEGDSILLLPLSDDLDKNLKKSYKKLGSMTGYPMLSIPYKGDKDEYIELYMLSSSFNEKRLIQLANKIEIRFNSHGERHNRYTPDCRQNEIEERLDSREKRHNCCAPYRERNETKEKFDSHGGEN